MIHYLRSLCILSSLSFLIVLSSGDVQVGSTVRDKLDLNIKDFNGKNADSFEKWFEDEYTVGEVDPGDGNINGGYNKGQSGKQRPGNGEFTKVKPSYAFSPHAMKRLVVTEAKIYNQMKNYVETMDSRLDLMKRYLKDYEESSINGTNHILRNETETEVQMSEEHQHAIVINPILTHRMIRRFAVSFVDIFKSFQTRLDEGMERRLISALLFCMHDLLHSRHEACKTVQNILRTFHN